jgi:hypothetical protein
MRTAALTRVERPDSGISDSVLSGCEPWCGPLFISVIFVTELRDVITRADRQIHTLAGPVPERELAL